MNSEFMSAINDLVKEKGIPKEMLLVLDRFMKTLTSR